MKLKGLMNLRQKMLPVVKRQTDKILIVMAAGAALLILFWPGKNTQTASADESTTAVIETKSVEEEKQEKEARLEALLNHLLQSTDVEVMITYQTSEEIVVNKDLEMGSGSKKENTVLDEKSQPYVIKENMPVVEGVVIVTGPIPFSTEKEISEAVQALFGLEAHKIKILKKES